MSSTVRRPKSVRSSSGASFYLYGPPQTDGYLESLFGDSPASGGSKPSALRSREGTPKASPASGPRRTPRRRASQQTGPLEDKRARPSSKATARPQVPISPIPVVAARPVRSPYVNTATVVNLQKVRFNASPEMIEASPESEYGTIPLGEDPEIWRAFIAADTDRSGLIDRSELQTALVNSPWNKPFEAATIDMLINIFDLNKNKQIEYKEFLGLSKYVKEWRNEFEKADRDRSGTIDVEELRKALKHFGYRLPLKTVKMLYHKHASHSYPQGGNDGITFDQFIRACVAVQELAKTFEQFNGGRDRRDASNFENFVLAAVST